MVSMIMSSGPIILQESVPVENGDTAEILQKRVLKTEHKLLPLGIKLFAEGKLKIIEKEGERTKVEVEI